MSASFSYDVSQHRSNLVNHWWGSANSTMGIMNLDVWSQIRKTGKIPFEQAPNIHTFFSPQTHP